MKLVEGRLTRLGESTIDMKSERVRYSLIQIGEKTLTNAVVSRKLSNFLNDGLQTEQPTKLWFLNGGKFIAGVQVGSETRYYDTANTALYVSLFINIALCCAFFLFLPPLVGLFWMVFIGMVLGRRLFDYQQVAAVGGTRI